MIFLVDYNLNRQALLLSGTLLTGQWLDLVLIRLITFDDVGLSADSNDPAGISPSASANCLAICSSKLNDLTHCKS